VAVAGIRSSEVDSQLVVGGSWAVVHLQVQQLKIPKSHRMSTYSDANTALEQDIAAMRVKILEQFTETSPDCLSVSDVCFITSFTGDRKVTLSPD
jgi:hypothetical protein